MDLKLPQIDYVNKYKKLMSKCHEIQTWFDGHKPGLISVSTITMIIDFNHVINLENFNSFFTQPENELIEWSIETSKRRKKLEQSDEKTTFYNQTTLRFRDITQKSIKIFRNGRLQMTGITSMYEGIDVALRVANVLENTEGTLDMSEEIKLKIHNINIGMINTNFSLKMGINLQALLRLCLQEEIKVTYDPDVYPGLKVKLMPSGKVFVFGTGKVVITGAKDLEDIIYAYTKLNEIVRDNWETVKFPEQTREKESKSSIPIIHGYPLTSIQSMTIGNFS